MFIFFHRFVEHFARHIETCTMNNFIKTKLVSINSSCDSFLLLRSPPNEFSTTMRSFHSNGFHSLNCLLNSLYFPLMGVEDHTGIYCYPLAKSIGCRFLNLWRGISSQKHAWSQQGQQKKRRKRKKLTEAIKINLNIYKNLFRFNAMYVETGIVLSWRREIWNKFCFIEIYDKQRLPKEKKSSKWR